MTFKTTTKIHFDEADPAGIAFSGTLFTKAHRCYEEFIAKITSAEDFFLNPEAIYPIRHTETEFLAPLFPLKSYEVLIQVNKLGDTSFQLQFDIQKEGRSRAIVRTTHVCVDKKTMKKQGLPSELKESLQKFVTQQ